MLLRHLRSLTLSGLPLRDYLRALEGYAQAHEVLDDVYIEALDSAITPKRTDFPELPLFAE